MNKLVLFPMQRGEKGTLVFQAIDAYTTNGSKLVAVYPPQQAFLTDLPKDYTFWVDVRASGAMEYNQFCTQHAVTLEGHELQQMFEADGSPKMTKPKNPEEAPKPLYGIVPIRR